MAEQKGTQGSTPRGGRQGGQKGTQRETERKGQGSGGTQKKSGSGSSRGNR